MTVDELRRYFLTANNEAECAVWMQRALQAATSFVRNSENLKIHSDISLPQLEQLFSEVDFPAQGEGLEKVFKETLDRVVRHSVRLASPHYVGHMTGATPYFGLVVDLLASALNQNVVKIETALAASFVEGQSVSWIHKLVYDREPHFYQRIMHNPELALGNVTSGGTLGNLTALAVARNCRLPKARKQGVAAGLVEGGWKRAVILASKRVHYSIRKAASVLGLGTENVLRIPVEPFTNQIDVTALERTLTELAQENTLVLAIVGIAGSTETGSIDDLRALGSLARARGIWFHVDAAWGGPLLLSDSHRALLAGIELADSVVMDGHKFFYLPLSHGMVVFRDEHALDSLRHSARYIIRKGSVDLGRTSLEGSRRFDSFKMWFSLKVLGRDGYKALIDHSLGLARRFAADVDQHRSFELTSRQETNIFTYRFIPSSWKQALSNHREKLRTRAVNGLTARSAEFIPEQDAFDFANQVLNEVNVELQKIQRRNGRSFVSRTMLESLCPGQESVVLRVVLFNPLTTSDILTDILIEQEELGMQLARRRWKRLAAQKPSGFETFLAAL